MLCHLGKACLPGPALGLTQGSCSNHTGDQGPTATGEDGPGPAKAGGSVHQETAGHGQCAQQALGTDMRLDAPCCSSETEHKVG